MDAYGEFAFLYDELTSDVNYSLFFSYIKQILEKNNCEPQLVLELACGTGSLTKLLAKDGYDVIAADRSEQMLSVAREKCPDVLFLEQDMTSFELYGTVDLILCMLDSVNYVTDKRKLLSMFRLVNNYLNPGGLFLFDINSPHYLKKVIGNNTFVEETDRIFYVWDNECKKDRVHFYLTFFVKEGQAYRRFDEVHTERIYQQQEILDLLEQSGLNPLAVYGDFTFEKPRKNADRIFFLAGK